MCQCNLEENKPESFIAVGLDNDVIVRACASKIPSVTSRGRPLTIKKKIIIVRKKEKKCISKALIMQGNESEALCQITGDPAMHYSDELHIGYFF